jgi:hypothetical protein
VRARRWDALRLAYVAVLMAWDGGVTLAEQFAAARATVTDMFPCLRRVGRTYPGFVKALARSGAGLRERVAVHLRGHVRQLQACWQVVGLTAFAVDGSRIECPRTADNQRELKRAGRKQTGPQLSLTTLYHMGSGCVWDYRLGPGPENERAHLRAMLGTLPPEALLVADAGFIGYDLLREILGRGRHVLFRVGSNRRLLKHLGYARCEGDDTVYLWPQEAQHQARPPVVLRLLVLRGGRHPVYVVTDLLSEAALSLEQASVLYRLRWGVEVFYRSLKQTLRQRKMRSGAPRQAKPELAWALTGLWLLSLLGVQALLARGKTPHSLSIALARRGVRQAMAGRLRPGTDLRRHLGRAVKDGYVRRTTKSARNWPHKKNDRPPGPPKIQSATPEQVQHAQQLRDKTMVA